MKKSKNPDVNFLSIEELEWEQEKRKQEIGQIQSLIDSFSEIWVKDITGSSLRELWDDSIASKIGLLIVGFFALCVPLTILLFLVLFCWLLFTTPLSQLF